MNYSGIDCPVCNQKFNTDDDIVVCPICGTPHHRHCWNEIGTCANTAKHSEGFVWQTAVPAQSEATMSKTGKICPRCGEHNSNYEPVCTRCGERLKANRETIHDRFPPYNPAGFDFGNGNTSDFQTPPNPNNYSPYQNVYAADARAVFGAETVIEDIPVTEIAEYVQKNSNQYISSFLKTEKKKSKVSWNWSAALCSVFWCFYRKMTGCGWALAAILLSCYMLSSVIPATVYEHFRPEVYQEYEQNFIEFYENAQEYVETGVLPDDYRDSYTAVLTSPIMLSSYLLVAVTFVITNLLFALFANNFYKKKILKDIRNIRQVSVDSLSYHMYIRAKGGVSLIGAFLPVFIFMGFITILSYF